MPLVTDILSVVTNAATALVAAGALYTWRRQIAGASQHELAKRLARAIRQVAIARDSTLTRLERRARGGPLQSLIDNSLFSDIEKLNTAVAELSSLEGEVAVLWGGPVLPVVEAIRKESFALSNHVEGKISTAQGIFAKKIMYNAPEIAPSFTRGAYKRSLDELTELVQQWLAFYLGRENAKLMSSKEFSMRSQNLHDEFAERARSESLLIERDACQELASDADHSDSPEIKGDS